MPKQPVYTLKKVSRKLLSLIETLSNKIAEEPKVDKITIAYMEQLNNLVDRVLIMQGKPTIIKKDIKQVVKDTEEKPIDVNSVLDTFANANGKQ